MVILGGGGEIEGDERRRRSRVLWGEVGVEKEVVVVVDLRRWRWWWF